jgi:hypothetical protein
MIQGASFDPNQNLILARLGVGNVFVTENFWTAEFVDANGFHGSLGKLRSYHKSAERSSFWATLLSATLLWAVYFCPREQSPFTF